jgi:hypothetical protein
MMQGTTRPDATGFRPMYVQTGAMPVVSAERPVRLSGPDDLYMQAW